MDENAVRRELPCLECQQYCAMRVRARLGAVVWRYSEGKRRPRCRSTTYYKAAVRGVTKRLLLSPF